MNGFEDMDTVVAMTQEDMRSMGILPVGYHCVSVLCIERHSAFRMIIHIYIYIYYMSCFSDVYE